MRQLRKEEREELDRAEATQTGGQEHASRADREGGGAAREEDRPAAEPSEADELRGGRS
jgi:hypothetical protein